MVNIISIMFLILILVNFYVLTFIFSQSKRRRNCHIAFGFLLITLVILYSSTVDFSILSNNNVPVNMIKKIHKQQANIYIVIFFIILTGSIILLYKEKEYIMESITRTSIKESIDNLPMGLCFSTKKGIVLLSNNSMNQLCHQITGRQLQDGEFFWQKIIQKEKELGENFEEDQHNPVLQLNNGEAWSFSRKTIKLNNKEGVQITAINITELYRLGFQLKEKNLEFMKLNNRLHQYSKNLANIKSKEERLATKTQLHNELGYILLATRRTLVNQNLDKEGETILALWKQNIGALRSGKGLKEKSVFAELLGATRDIGIELKLEGKLPQEGKNKDLILSATIEALNNAVRHAEATELKLSIEERDKEYKVGLVNDGLLPEKEITEGGGLSALRVKVEGHGGKMGVDTEPTFKLWIIIPKGRELVSHDKSINSGR